MTEYVVFVRQDNTVWLVPASHVARHALNDYHFNELTTHGGTEYPDNVDAQANELVESRWDILQSWVNEKMAWADVKDVAIPA